MLVERRSVRGTSSVWLLWHPVSPAICLRFVDPLSLSYGDSWPYNLPSMSPNSSLFNMSEICGPCHICLFPSEVWKLASRASTKRPLDLFSSGLDLGLARLLKYDLLTLFGEVDLRDPFKASMHHQQATAHNTTKSIYIYIYIYIHMYVYTSLSLYIYNFIIQIIHASSRSRQGPSKDPLKY